MVDNNAETQALRLLEAVWALEHSLQSRSKKMQREMGLTGLQRTVIRILRLHPNSTAGVLAKALHVHPSTLTGVLVRLEKKGLLRRNRHPDDDRKVVLEVTSEGAKYDVPHPSTAEFRVRRFISEISSEELALFETRLRRLSEMLDE